MVFMGSGLLLSTGLAAYSAVEVFLWRSQVSLQAKSWMIFWVLSSISMVVGMASMGKKLSGRLTIYLESFLNKKRQRFAIALSVGLLVLVGFTIQVKGGDR